MSVPPQFIRVKRKRDEESPVTFLQFDEVVKRHRSGTHWVYQRRESTASAQTPTSPLRPSREPQPVIHVSAPNNETQASATQKLGDDAAPRRLIRGMSPARIRKSSITNNLAGPRKFHLSRVNLAPDQSQQINPGGLKRPRAEPTIFVERSRRRAAQHKAAQDQPAPQLQASPNVEDGRAQESTQGRPLKKPGVAKRARPQPSETGTHFPLPTSFTQRDNENLDKITADMNEWVMNELGANLHAMDQEKSHTEKPRFKPRAPSKRYQDRHPEANVAKQTQQDQGQQDTTMAELSEEDGDEDDWVIDEYIRIPADSMSVDVAPADVGFLVLEGDEENTLFFGPERDEEDDYLEDEDDENAENHYTADYPEDEVDTDDEFDRHPYMFRNENASDEEEYDNRNFDDNDDEMVLEGDDDDATMARIKTYMRRNAAFR